MHETPALTKESNAQAVSPGVPRAIESAIRAQAMGRLRLFVGPRSFAHAYKE